VSSPSALPSALGAVFFSLGSALAQRADAGLLTAGSAGRSEIA
jgi:hypothetical protein